MGVKFSQLPIASQLAPNDYIAVLDTSEGELKRTALSNLGGKGTRASYDETTALYAHSVDDIILVNNTLYKVTSAIAVGDTIAVGTNVSTDTGLTANDQIYVDNLPGGGGGGSVDVDDEFSPTSTNPVENSVITNAIGPTETGSTSSAAYDIDDVFIFDGQLVKATTAIAINDALVIGTNIATCTIAEMLKVLHSEVNAAYSNVAVDPASTEGMNIWISTE